MNVWAKNDIENWSDDHLIKRSEKLKDLFTPNGQLWDELMELLEIERQLTKRETNENDLR